MSVQIVNTTTVPVKISEGSVGTYYRRSLIHAGTTFYLKVDRSATYREYLLTTEPENLPVGSTLTSDDVADYSKIEIKEIGTPRDDPVWVGISNPKRRGCMRGCMMFLRRLLRNQPVRLKICNGLTDQHVTIVEGNDEEQPFTLPRHHIIADLAPGKAVSIIVDPNNIRRYYRFKAEFDGELGRRVNSDHLKLFSKIEITKTSKEYIWEGIS